MYHKDASKAVPAKVGILDNFMFNFVQKKNCSSYELHVQVNIAHSLYNNQ